MVPPNGRLAQWKSARLTRERSLVRPQRRPPPHRPARQCGNNASVKTSLVTGADGFIGTVLCRRLEAQGTRVHRLVRKGGGIDTIVADLGRDPIQGSKGVRPEEDV